MGIDQAQALHHRKLINSPSNTVSAKQLSELNAQLYIDVVN